MKYLLLMTTIIFLMRVSHAVLATPAAPFSYVQSLQFQSYQFAPYVTSGTAISPLFNITLTYTDPYTYVSSSPPTTAIALCGLENVNNQYVGFTIDPYTGANPYSTIFQIALSGLTTLNYISFFFTMINSTATSHFSIINVIDSGISLTSSGNMGSPISTSPDAQVAKPASFTGVSTYVYLIQSFKVACTGSTDCYVEVRDTGTTASNFNYTFRTDGNNTLEEVVFNLFIYTTTYSSPYFSHGFQSNDFATLITALQTATGGNGFAASFNGKCLLGMSKIIFSTTSFNLHFDMNNAYPYIKNTTNYLHTTPDVNLHIFCLLEQFDCSKIDANCITCNTQSTYIPDCTDCTNPYYVNGGLCSPCTPLLIGCIHCENSTVCLACDPAFYYDIASSICLDCITYLMHCQNCSSINQCDICDSGYGLNNATSCLACGILITNCQFCTNTSYCSSCLMGFYLNGLSNGCLPCSTIPNCVSCLNATFCTACLTDFKVDVDNYHCVCNAGLYPVTGFCAGLGCISAYRFTTSVACLACDTSLHFQLANAACTCQTGFNLTATNCSEICGDGMVFKADCDDGNLVNGDGCSNKCLVQSNYRCLSGSPTHASNCLYITPLNPTIKNVIKTLDSNQMEIQLQVNNGFAPLDLTVISNFVAITIGGVLYTGLSSSFDSKLTLVTLLVPYNSTIEGQPVVLYFGYDPAQFYLPVDTLTFDAKGSNMALVYQPTPAGNDEMVQNLGYAVAGLSLLFLLASTPFHRIVGLETFQVTQLVFFSRYMVVDSNSGTFQALNSLKYIDLYNYFANYPNVRSLQGPLIRLGFTKTFLFNVAIQFFLVAVAWVCFAIFNRTFQRLKHMNMAESNSILQMFKKYKLLTYICSNIVFTLTTSTFFILVFSYLSSVQTQKELATSLPAELLFLNVALFAYACLYICNNVYRNFKEPRKYNEEEGCYYRHLTIFLIYYLLSSTITMAGGQLGKFALAGVQLIYLLILIFYRPYLLTMHNVGLIINQTVILAFSALLILNDIASFLHGLRGYVLLGMEVLLIAVNIIGCVRLYVHVKYNQKAFELAKADAEKAKLGPKEEFKIPQQNKNRKLSNALHKTIFERQKQLREKDESALQRLKNRLKAEFKEKGEEERGSLIDQER